MKNKYVCKFCNKEFPSGKSLGGHIRIHTNKVSVKSDSYIAKKNKRLVDQREEEEQLCCRECGKGFVSLKALCAHMDIHCEIEKKKIVMDDNQSDETETETSLSPTRKRSKNSESFTNVSLSSGSVIDQEDKDGALSLMIMFRESSSFKKGHNNSLAESSDNNSLIVETKSSSGEKLKNFNVLETDKDGVDDDDNGVTTCDSDGSDSDYFMNGPKKSDSDISVHGSLRNRLRNSDEVGVKEGGSKNELMRKSKMVFTSHETDSCADTSSKILHRSSDRKSTMVKKDSGTNKYSDGHVCPYCFRVFKSGQALGGHKRSHSLGNQEHRGAEKRNQIDLNVPAQDIDE